VGGDFYDIFQLSGGRLGICISDVVGKGLPAALLMASLRASLRAHAPYDDRADDTVSRVNRHLCQDTVISEFATLAYGIIDADSTTMTYCNAGHLSPVLLREGSFRELGAGGLVLGVVPETPYEQETVSLAPGDVVVMITDGIIEALNFEDEAYGRHRFLQSIERHQRLDSQQLAEQILWDVRRFIGLAPMSDDITILAMKVRR